MTRADIAATNEVPIFLSEGRAARDTTGLLAVLAHKAIGTIANAGVAVNTVRRNADESADRSVLAACDEVDHLLARAVARLRENVVQRSDEVVDVTNGSS